MVVVELRTSEETGCSCPFDNQETVDKASLTEAQSLASSASSMMSLDAEDYVLVSGEDGHDVEVAAVHNEDVRASGASPQILRTLASGAEEPHALASQNMEPQALASQDMALQQAQAGQDMEHQALASQDMALQQAQAGQDMEHQALASQDMALQQAQAGQDMEHQALASQDMALQQAQAGQDMEHQALASQDMALQQAQAGQDMEHQALASQDMVLQAALQALASQDMEHQAFASQDMEQQPLAPHDMNSQQPLASQDMERQALASQDIDMVAHGCQELARPALTSQDMELQAFLQELASQDVEASPAACQDMELQTFLEELAGQDMEPQPPASQDMEHQAPASQDMEPQPPASPDMEHQAPASQDTELLSPASQDVESQPPASQDMEPRAPPSQDMEHQAPASQDMPLPAELLKATPMPPASNEDAPVQAMTTNEEMPADEAVANEDSPDQLLTSHQDVAVQTELNGGSTLQLISSHDVAVQTAADDMKSMNSLPISTRDAAVQVSSQADTQAPSLTTTDPPPGSSDVTPRPVMVSRAPADVDKPLLTGTAAADVDKRSPGQASEREKVTKEVATEMDSDMEATVASSPGQMLETAQHVPSVQSQGMEVPDLEEEVVEAVRVGEAVSVQAEQEQVASVGSREGQVPELEGGVVVQAMQGQQGAAPPWYTTAMAEEVCIGCFVLVLISVGVLLVMLLLAAPSPRRSTPEGTCAAFMDSLANSNRLLQESLAGIHQQNSWLHQVVEESSSRTCPSPDCPSPESKTFSDLESAIDAAFKRNFPDVDWSSLKTRPQADPSWMLNLFSAEKPLPILMDALAEVLKKGPKHSRKWRPSVVAEVLRATVHKLWDKLPASDNGTEDRDQAGCQEAQDLKGQVAEMEKEMERERKSALARERQDAEVIQDLHAKVARHPGDLERTKAKCRELMDSLRTKCGELVEEQKAQKDVECDARVEAKVANSRDQAGCQDSDQVAEMKRELKAALAWEKRDAEMIRDLREDLGRANAKCKELVEALKLQKDVECDEKIEEETTKARDYNERMAELEKERDEALARSAKQAQMIQNLQCD